MEVASMGMRLNACVGNGGKALETRWISKRREGGSRTTRIPIFISTTPSLVNPHHLKHLYTICNHSCYRFPPLDHNGKVVEPVDMKKLCLALSHSSILVSVFCNLRDVLVNDNKDRPLMGLGDLLRLPPLLNPSEAQLVGFGRAVSDFGLTAAIYDVMVIPSLQGMGIGKMIVHRMIRMLTSRDIYDISALCSVNESLFFKACGFKDDILGSTTMMYTSTASAYSEGEQMVTRAGRKLLLVPPLRISSET